MWMTVGSGNHRIIYLPNAELNYNSENWLIAFSMFTKVQPVEIPIIAYAFGRGDLTALEVGTDTVQFGAGFKRIKDYAVANGMKIDLACYPYYMQSQNVTANKTTATAYADAFPNNIRLTMSAGSSWYPTAYANMLSAGTYAEKVTKIKYTQDSIGVYFPTMNTTRLESYSAWFASGTDSILSAIANRGITDVYNWGPTTGGSAAPQYPSSASYLIVGPQRTWINDGGTLHEMRFHTIGYIARYTLHETTGSPWTGPDGLRVVYTDTVTANGKRASLVTGLLSGLTFGNVQAGMYLPAFTFCGGSKTSWTASGRDYRRASVDSSRSIFLDMMKQLNSMKRMGDYIVSTYGTTGQSPIIWAWLDEVKWDRRNGRQFPNSHVRME
jgi:hypothetical protein